MNVLGYLPVFHIPKEFSFCVVREIEEREKAKGEKDKGEKGNREGERREREEEGYMSAVWKTTTL